MDIVNNYLYLEQMRFKDALEVEQKMMTDVNSCEIPPFVIQMAIENAIKHNVISRTRKLTISILATSDEVVVINNIQKKRTTPPSTSTGQKNTTERYRLLSDKLPTFVETTEAYVVTLPLLHRSKESALHSFTPEEPDHTWTVS
jgi:sensor histidine kinase YesM